MATLPINNVPVIPDGEYYEITNGLLVINIREDEFTDTMKRYLAGIVFQMYTKITSGSEDIYIPIKDVSYIWNDKEDEAITFDNIPDGSFMTISAMVDKAISIIRDLDGSYKYDISGIDSFPIEISIV